MADHTGIEWTNAAWNPVTGCTKVGQGCKNCYAERMAYRLQAMGVPQYRDGFKLTLQPALDIPRSWKRPRVIFVNSMSDLFHQDVPPGFIRRVFSVMNECPRHTFHILTKRPELAATFAADLNWSENVWMGTSVENALVAYRVASLREVPAKVRFLSIEPLIGPIRHLSLQGIHWVIVGGESGPGHPRSMSGVACAVLQAVGGVDKKAAGRVLDGRTWDELSFGLSTVKPRERSAESGPRRSVEVDNG